MDRVALFWVISEETKCIEVIGNQKYNKTKSIRKNTYESYINIFVHKWWFLPNLRLMRPPF